MRTIQLTPDVMFAMCKNLTYFAIHSGAAASGAYVGANPLNCYRPGTLTFSYTGFGFDSTQTLAPAITGTFNVETRQLTVSMDLQALTAVTGVHLHGSNPTQFSGPGNPFTNGGSASVMIPLGGAVTSIDSVLTVSAANATAICDRRTYFVIHTQAYQNGAYGAILDVNCYGTSGTVAPVGVPTVPPALAPATQAPAITPFRIEPCAEGCNGVTLVLSLATAVIAALAFAF